MPNETDLDGMNYEVMLVPQDMNTHNPSNWIDISGYSTVHVVILCGAMAADCSAITINIGTDLSETHTSTFAYDTYYKKADVSAYAAEDATPSGIFTRTTGAAGTFATGATANQIFVIPIKVAELGEYSAALPYKCIQLHITDPGNTDIIGALVVGLADGARFKKQIPPSMVGYPAGY